MGISRRGVVGGGGGRISSSSFCTPHNLLSLSLSLSPKSQKKKAPVKRPPRSALLIKRPPLLNGGGLTWRFISDALLFLRFFFNRKSSPSFLAILPFLQSEPLPPSHSLSLSLPLLTHLLSHNGREEEEKKGGRRRRSYPRTERPLSSPQSVHSFSPPPPFSSYTHNRNS